MSKQYADAAVYERKLQNEFDNLPETVEECRPYYDALPWEKAIVVYIGLPE